MKEIGLRLPPTIEKILQDYLDEDEEVFDAISSVWSIFRGTDILLYTDKRIVHVKKRPWVADVDSYNYGDDAFLELEAGPVYDTLKIQFKEKTAFSMPVFASRRHEAMGFIHRAEQHIEKANRAKRGGGKKGERDFKEELEKLAGLCQEGILTKEEFEEKKKKILDEI